MTFQIDDSPLCIADHLYHMVVEEDMDGDMYVRAVVNAGTSDHVARKVGEALADAHDLPAAIYEVAHPSGALSKFMLRVNP